MPTPTPGGGGSTPAPNPGGTAPTVPTAPSESALTAANRTLTAPASARPGDTITIGVGREHAGERVHVWMTSTPVLLGTETVASDGTVRVTIPADASAGPHRIVVTALDGTVLGWTTITIDPTTGTAVIGGLAYTGTDIAGGIAAALLLVAAGAGVLAVRRRAPSAPTD